MRTISILVLACCLWGTAANVARSHHDSQKPEPVKKLIDIQKQLQAVIKQLSKEHDIPEPLPVPEPTPVPIDPEPVDPDPIDIEPDKTGKVIFKFDGVSQDQFEKYNDQVMRRLQNPSPQYERFEISDTATTWYHSRVDPPILENPETFLCISSRKTRDPKGHNELRVWSKLLNNGTQTSLNKTYRCKFKMEILSIEKSQDPERSYTIFFQFWGPSYGLVDFYNPPFALMTFRGKLRVQGYAGKRGATKKTRKDFSEFLDPPEAGWHDWEVLYRPTYNDEGFAIVKKDGKEIYSYRGMTSIENSKDVGPVINLGCYASRSSEASALRLRDIEIAELD